MGTPNKVPLVLGTPEPKPETGPQLSGGPLGELAAFLGSLDRKFNRAGFGNKGMYGGSLWVMEKKLETTV